MEVEKSDQSEQSGESNQSTVPYTKLQVFLHGTVQYQSPLKLLRGQQDILRIIWIYACSEWWSLHIQPYTIPLIALYNEEDGTTDTPSSADGIAHLQEFESFDRKDLMDCPLAIVDEDIQFPPVGTMPSFTVENESQPIAVNMMPFDLFDPETTLPTYLHGYLPLIYTCRQYNKHWNAWVNELANDDNDNEAKDNDDGYDSGKEERERDLAILGDIKRRIAYITVDERPTEIGKSQRREGVHVESPGSLRPQDCIDKYRYTPDLGWYHPWGMGHTDAEYLVGGIFIASNMSNTTAVWNSRVHDTFGDIIGKHGSLERCRSILGEPSKLLKAGELVWMTDRTPHESLPIPIEEESNRRQFFRLVIGAISFWFADHSTANPTGFAVPDHVPIVHGNKFSLTKDIPVIWECGTKEEIEFAKKQAEFREKLYENGIGLLEDIICHQLGITDRNEFMANEEKASDSVGKFLDKEDNLYTCYTKSFIRSKLDNILWS